MAFHVQFEEHELPDLKKLLLRALNCWSDAPKWAFELDAKVDEKLASLNVQPDFRPDSAKQERSS